MHHATASLAAFPRAGIALALVSVAHAAPPGERSVGVTPVDAVDPSRERRQ